MKLSKIPTHIFNLYRPKLIFSRNYNVYNGQRRIKVGLLSLPNNSDLPKGTHFVLLTFSPKTSGHLNHPHSHLYLCCYDFGETSLICGDDTESVVCGGERVASSSCVIVYDTKPNRDIWEKGKGYWINERVHFEMSGKLNLCVSCERHVVDLIQYMQAQAMLVIEHSDNPKGGFWEREIRPGPFNEKPNHLQW